MAVDGCISKNVYIRVLRKKIQVVAEFERKIQTGDSKHRTKNRKAHLVFRNFITKLLQFSGSNGSNLQMR